jgi:hypothetical protein
MQDAKHNAQRLRGSGEQHEETSMRKIILVAFGAALMAASTAQVAAAAQHHHARKVERAISGEQFRNANNAAASPAQPGWYYGGYSAPAGH